MNFSIGERCLGILTIVFLCSSAAWADPGQPTTEAPKAEFAAIYDRGNQAYLHGDYPSAVAEYQKLVEAGLVHPDLYYNLANSYYRNGRNGLAVLFYEKTLDLSPEDSAAQSNLAAIKKELIDRVLMSESGAVGEPLWHEFIRGLSLGWLTWTFLSLYLVVFFSLIVRRLIATNAIKRILFWFNVPLITVALVFGLLLGNRIYVQERVHHGVVVVSSVALREGPERTAKVLLEVHEGLKVLLLNEVGDFIRVRLVNGVEGFLLNTQVGRI